MFSIKIASEISKSQRLKQSAGQRGTPRKMLAGTWIGDLVALQKALVLCESCAKKFNPKSSGYVFKQLVPGTDHVIGDCDGCGGHCQGKLYLPERGN